MNRRHLASALLLLVVAPQIPAQFPPPLPFHGRAPLLFVRFSGPLGMKASFFEGPGPFRTFPAPVDVGLRPGYRYRLQLTNFEGRPNLDLFPTLEVRNTLVLPPGIRPSNYPAVVTMTDEDIDAVLAGSLITKVIYLEHPDKAVPQATRKNQPLELTLPPDEDLLAAARKRGRPMLILRLGQRIVPFEELAADSIAGTILFPGEPTLAQPRVPPPLAFDCVRFFDPRHGPRPPEEECLHDGGDRAPLAGLDHIGTLRGLDPEDAIAEWTDSAGRRRLTPSNRVCLCVPRYGVLRHELPLGRYEGLVRVDDTRYAEAENLLRSRQPPALAAQQELVKAARSRARAAAAMNAEALTVMTQLEILQGRVIELGVFELLGTRQVQRLTEFQRLNMTRQIELVRRFSQFAGLRGFELVEGTAVVGRIEAGAAVVRATAEVRDITVCCHEAPIPPDQPLRLFKWADRQAAQVGDVVTFSLKYSNVGGRPITDVAVSDSLSPRLEYVPGTSQTDRDAVFTVQPNEAGSTVLRWEVRGTLQPGTSGVVRFQARIR